MKITIKNHISVEASIWNFWKSRRKHIKKRANVILSGNQTHLIWWLN